MTSKSIEIGFSNFSPMFTNDMENELRAAWTQRSHELTAQQLQEHADAVYLDLAMKFLNKCKLFADALLDKIRTATSPKDLQIPLYTFNVCHAANGKIPYSAFVKGWHTTVTGTLRDDDGYEDTVLDQKSLFQIFTYTDVLKRLALLWGGREFWIDFQRTDRIVAEDAELTVAEYAVVLRYWPRGLPEARIEELKAVQEKYQTYSGCVSANLKLYYDAGAYPTTPPRSVSSREPPKAPRRPLVVRSNGGGIARSLAFEL